MSRRSDLGEQSSTAELLHGLRFGRGKHPGDAVIKDVRKSQTSPKRRYFVMYSGKVRAVSRSGVAKMARDRGFDVSHQRYVAGDASVKADMLRRSLRWQGNAKKRWVKRMAERVASTKHPGKKAELTRRLSKIRRAPVNSPHTGKRPVSSYVRTWWR